MGEIFALTAGDAMSSLYQRALSLLQEEPVNERQLAYPTVAGIPTILQERGEEDRKDVMRKKQAHVAAVARASGWSQERAKREMDAAAEKGVPYHIYRKNKCWDWSTLEIERLGAYRREREREFINEVREQSGCTEKQARLFMKQADASRLKRESYLHYRGWSLSKEELEELATALKLRRERKRADEQRYIDAVCYWTKEQKATVFEHMNMAKGMGIPFNRYVQFACWTRTPEELEQLASWLEGHSQQNRKRKETYVASVRQETGWSEGRVHLEALKAQAAYGASYEDYFGFKLHRYPLEKQGEFVTLQDWNLLKARVNNNASVLALLNDKPHFNELFDHMINHVWFVNRNVTMEDFLEKIEGLDAILVKPVASLQGQGITKHACNQSEEENRALYAEIMERERSIIEGCIEQHPDMASFCPQSVNTVRVTTLQDGETYRLLYAILRMGTGSPVDNFHAGGIAAGIDTLTGAVETVAIDLRGNAYAEHPVTGRNIRGFQVPHWERVLEASEEAAGLLPDIGLVGWDFAITPDGVDLIEGNGGSGYVAVQMIYAMEGKGLRKQLLGPWD